MLAPPSLPTRDERVLELSLTVPVRPKGQGRPRFDSRSGRAYTPPATRAYVDTVRAAAMAAWGDREPLGGPIGLDVRAFFALPKSFRGERTHHLQRPDGSNIYKAAEDALLPHRIKRRAGWEMIWRGLFNDDSQVIEGRFRKAWCVAGDALVINVWRLS